MCSAFKPDRQHLDGIGGNLYNVAEVVSQVHKLNIVAGNFYKLMNSFQAEIERAIINTVSYVDAFDYPLTAAEIHRYLIHLPITSDKIKDTLAQDNLVPDRLRRSGEYYMLPGRENVVAIRQQRLATAQRLWPSARHYGRLIANMPYVRMVAVTGSLAVNNVGTEEDIDYLIITADDHLWVCRAFIILIVRLAALQGIIICPNYFLTERALPIKSKNLYTAHELTQMVPLHGINVYNSLRLANSWTKEFLPNANGVPKIGRSITNGHNAFPKRRAKRFVEKILNTTPGQKLDRWEMARKINKFQQLYSGWQEAEFTEDSCKGHFNRHQHRALRAYEQLVSNDVNDEYTSLYEELTQVST